MDSDQTAIITQKLIRTLAQFWRVGGQKSSFLGIKRSEFMLLATLIRSTSASSPGIRVCQLSTQLQITSAAVTHMITSLEEAGYVQRQHDPSDRRAVLVKPTMQGEELYKQVNKDHQDFLNGLVNFLGEQDSRELIRLLSVVLSYAQERRNIDAKKPKA